MIFYSQLCSWQPVRLFWCKAVWQQRPDAMSDMASEAEACHVWHGMPSSRPRCHHIIRARPLLMPCPTRCARCVLVVPCSERMPVLFSQLKDLLTKGAMLQQRRMDAILIWWSKTISPGVTPGHSIAHLGRFGWKCMSRCKKVWPFVHAAVGWGERRGAFLGRGEGGMQWPVASKDTTWCFQCHVLS